MAHLLPNSFVPKTTVALSGPDFMKHLELQDAEIAREGLGTIRIPVADGAAVYIVRSLKPAKLQHVWAGDAWHADAATIRGLRPQDISLIMTPAKP